MIQAVLFDYGETLVRPRRAWKEVRPNAIRSTFSVMKRAGLGLSYDEFAERNNSLFQRYILVENEKKRDIRDLMKYQDLAAELFPGRSKTWHREVASRANAAFWKVVNHNYILNSNARKTLAELKRMKIGMSVISNHHNPEALSEHLNQLHVSKYFSRIYASAQLRFRKPDSRIFELCISAMKVAPSQAVFVGDSLENDVAGAKAVGLRTILMAASPLNDPASKAVRVEPDFTIHDLGEVPDIISSLR